MTYLAAIVLMVVIVAGIATAFWGIPLFTRERPSSGPAAAVMATAPPPMGFRPGSASRKESHGGWSQHLHASPALEWYAPGGQYAASGPKEAYGGRRQHLHASPALEWYAPGGQYAASGPKEAYGGWRQHLHASPALEWYAPGGQYAARGLKEGYGEPPGMLRAVHQDELGFRGWADMPGDYEGSSASAVSAYVQRSA